MTFPPLKCCLVFVPLLLGTLSAKAITIDTVPVGNPGNPSELQTNEYIGGVAYAYRIGTYEVTNAQYVAFLNSVDSAGTNALSLYHNQMTTDACGGINFNNGNGNGSKYEIKTGRASNPVTYTTWFDALRFTNWLHNDQSSSGTETGAYTLGTLGAGAVPVNGNNITRTANARWFLPSDNEWYKAAYHKNDGVTGNYWKYPTATDSSPYSDQTPGTGAPAPSNTGNFNQDDGVANGYDDGYAVTGTSTLNSSQNYLTDVGAYASASSPYGTFDQGGNVFEWVDKKLNSWCYARGGGWKESDYYARAAIQSASPATTSLYEIGFRVASIIAPSGDYDGNGIVDAADYVLWRKNDGSPAGYNTWRAHYGQILGSGSALSENAAVPEPGTVGMLMTFAILMLLVPTTARQFRH